MKPLAQRLSGVQLGEVAGVDLTLTVEPSTGFGDRDGQVSVIAIE